MRAAKQFLAILAAALLIPGFGSAVAGDAAQHWAYQPVVRPAAPSAATASGNPIDAFLQRELHQRGLTFSPSALPYEIVRRTKFDLLGLPPTREEVDAFAADPSDAAYERMIEGWLAVPHYGERWVGIGSTSSAMPIPPVSTPIRSGRWRISTAIM